MFTFHLWKSDEYQNKYNTEYPIECEVRGVDSLGEVAFRDHVCASYKDNKRGNDNFLWADDLPMDCDNSHSDDPDEWITPEGIEDRFGDCNYAITFSRNHMKPKGDKGPRPRFHVHFSIHKIKDVHRYTALKDAIVEEYPFFDDEAKDSARFFFGSRSADLPIWHEGVTTIDELIKPITVKQKPAKSKAPETVPADNTEKVVIEHGKRHGYLIRRIGYYVQTIGDTADDEMIFALLWVDFQQNCENDDHLDYEHIRSHYFNEIEKTRAKFAENKKDPGFFKYARKAWMNEHPGEEFDPDKVGWSEVEAAGHRAKEKNLLFDWRPAKRSTDNAEDTEVAQTLPFQELELTEKGEVKNTFSNVRDILERDPYLTNKFSYNMQNGLVYLTDFYWNKFPHVIRDADVTEIRSYIADHYGIAPSKDRSEELIQMIAERNKFHPVRDLLENLKPKGRPTTDNIGELLPRYLGAERSAFTTQVTKLLLYGIIQRQFSPGVKFDYCVILADELQGTGKSTMCRMLGIRDDWFTDSLNNLDDPQKAFEAINGCVVAEMGEMLATRRAKDVEGIKAFISRTVDKIRRPYLRHSEEFPRQCVFIGTTNKPQFLPEDKTGNRRFIPVICDGKKAVKHPLDNEKETREFVLQCFADAMVLGETEGWPLVLDRKFDMTLDRLREQGTPDDPRVGMIQQYLDDHTLIDYVCSRLIWDEVFSDCDHPKEPQSYELRDISDIMNLKIEGWKRYEFEDGSLRTGQRKHKFTDEFRKYGSQRAWKRIPPFEPGARVIDTDDEQDTPL